MAKISDMLAAGRTFSFEFFPPKNDVEQATLVKALRELEPLKPAFVSVTYRGGRSSRQRTHDLVAGILRTTSLTPMAHLICVDHTRIELAEILIEHRKSGIENLMALAGDPPRDDSQTPGELTHALELVELARAIGGFSIGVAAHPAIHPRSIDRKSDRDHLAEKLALADFAATQFFFELDEYLGLVSDLADRGVTKPVLPGIMPISSVESIPNMAVMGAAVPEWAQKRLKDAHELGGAEAVVKCGIDMATELCAALLENGAPGIHFFTLNKSKATREIYTNLGLQTGS